jgi:hypothetical protein
MIRCCRCCSWECSTGLPEGLGIYASQKRTNTRVKSMPDVCDFAHASLRSIKISRSRKTRNMLRSRHIAIIQRTAISRFSSQHGLFRRQGKGESPQVMNVAVKVAIPPYSPTNNIRRKLTRVKLKRTIIMIPTPYLPNSSKNNTGTTTKSKSRNWKMMTVW